MVGTRQRNFLKKIKSLCRVPYALALGKENFKIKNKKSLPSASRVGTRQRMFLKKIKNLCRVPHGLTLGKAAVMVALAVTATFLCRVSDWHLAKSLPSAR